MPQGKDPPMRMSPALFALLCGALPLSASATQPTSPVSAKPVAQARAHAGAPAAGTAGGVARRQQGNTPRVLLGAVPGKGPELPAHGIGPPASVTHAAPPKTTINKMGTVYRGGTPAPNVAQINGTAIGARGVRAAKIGAGAKSGATINGTAMPGR
jgi:hypothetical protein